MKPSCTAFVLILLFGLCSAVLGLRAPFEHISSGVWTPFDSWARLIPDVRQKYAVAATVVEVGINKSPRELMIMYGGVEYQPQDAATWIYDPELNTWQSLLLSSHPPVNAFHSMVSLCGRRVVLFGGADTGSGGISIGDDTGQSCKNETWMFDMIRKEWSVIAVRPGGGSFIRPRCKHAATPLYQPKSACTCKESMFVYGGKSVTLKGTQEQREDLFDMWELRCVKDGNDTALPVFEWLHVQFGSNSSLCLKDPRAFSVFNKSELLLSGWKNKNWQLWSMNLTERTWKEKGNRNDVLTDDRMVYMTERNGKSDGNFHILVYCCTEPMWTFNLESNAWYQSDPVPDVAAPEVELVMAATATVGGGVLVFGGDLNFRRTESTLWRLTALKPDLLQWKAVETEDPKLQYKGALAGGIVGANKVVLFGGIVSEPRRRVYSSDETWSLDLTTLCWSKEAVTEKPPGLVASAGVVLRRSYLVVFGGVQSYEKIEVFSMVRFNTDTFVYDYLATAWFKVIVDKRPSERVLPTALAVDNRTVMLFGGFFMSVSLMDGLQLLPCQDVWTFTLGNTSNLTHGEWSRRQDLRQCTYMGHASLIWNRTVVVYGGTHSALAVHPGSMAKLTLRNIFLSGEILVSVNCENKMWEYDLDFETWQQVNYSQNTGPGARCFPSFGVVGNNMIIHGGCSLRGEMRLQLNTGRYVYKCSVETSKSGVWSYNIKARMWTRLTLTNPINARRFYSLLLEWNGMILMFEGVPPELFSSSKTEDWTGFSVYKPECPAGTYTFDFSSTGCHPCTVGLYSSSSGPNCTRCPDNLSTPHVGSTSVDDCTVCSSTICDHGHCRVIVPGPEIYCECDFGYTKNDDGHCSVATYFLAGSGFLAGLLLLLVVAAVLVRLRRTRKSHRVALRNKDRELVELTNGWIVDCRELKLQERIDRRSPGGFGDVYKAVYRDITVAVKKLKEVMLDLERTELEFEREIQVMRTIRHPNIVLFLGVGRFHGDGCPFILMEYMSRGSLGSILRNTSLSLTNSQRIRFALDAAKGMRFLHGLRPPRIHRDLKSGHLLVSKRWVVKVADFGSARLVKDEAVDQEAVRGTGPLSLNAPLLQPQYELSTCVGTPFWTAPELLQGLSYGTAVDVYSFGLVLWEVWSRQLPFDDHHFPSVLDLKQAVMEGTRPTISNNWPCEYVALIRECWSGAAVYRPTFGQIVQRLENYNEKHLMRDHI